MRHLGEQTSVVRNRQLQTERLHRLAEHLRQSLRIVRDDAVHPVLDQLRGQPQVMRAVRVQRPGGHPAPRRCRSAIQSKPSPDIPPRSVARMYHIETGACVQSTCARGQVSHAEPRAVGRQRVIIEVAVGAGPAQVARSQFARSRVYVQVPQGIEAEGQLGRRSCSRRRSRSRCCSTRTRCHSDPTVRPRLARACSAPGYTPSDQAGVRPGSVRRRPPPRHRSASATRSSVSLPCQRRRNPRPSDQLLRRPSPCRWFHPPGSDRAEARSRPSASGLMSTSTKRSPVSRQSRKPLRVFGGNRLLRPAA